MGKLFFFQWQNSSFHMGKFWLFQGKTLVNYARIVDVNVSRLEIPLNFLPSNNPCRLFERRYSVFIQVHIEALNVLEKV